MSTIDKLKVKEALKEFEDEMREDGRVFLLKPETVETIRACLTAQLNDKGDGG